MKYLYFQIKVTDVRTKMHNTAEIIPNVTSVFFFIVFYNFCELGYIVFNCVLIDGSKKFIEKK